METKLPFHLSMNPLSLVSNSSHLPSTMSLWSPMLSPILTIISYGLILAPFVPSPQMSTLRGIDPFLMTYFCDQICSSSIPRMLPFSMPVNFDSLCFIHGHSTYYAHSYADSFYADLMPSSFIPSSSMTSHSMPSSSMPSHSMPNSSSFHAIPYVRDDVKLSHPHFSFNDFCDLLYF